MKDLNVAEALLVTGLFVASVAFFIMLAVPALGGPAQMGYLDYLAGCAGLTGFLRLVRVALGGLA